MPSGPVRFLLLFGCVLAAATASGCGSASAPPSVSTVTVTAPAEVETPLYSQFESADAVGPNGEHVDATLAGARFPSSTGMWVGCEGTPATTTYRLDRKFGQLRAVAGLQPHTPDQLSVSVTLTGDGAVLKEFTLTKRDTVTLDVPLDAMQTLVVSAIVRQGTCGASDTPYGALGDAVLTEDSGQQRS